MFGKRCTLCGGKLDSNNICKECGLNNNLSEKNYKVNQNQCDDMPLTHVHEESEKKRKWQKPKTEKKKSFQKKSTASEYDKFKKGKWTKKIVFIIVLFSIFGSIVSILISIGSAIFSDSESYEERNPYEVLYFRERYSAFYLMSINTTEQIRKQKLFEQGYRNDEIRLLDER